MGLVSSVVEVAGISAAMAAPLKKSVARSVREVASKDFISFLFRVQRSV
jgi:hypothetical protein